MRYRQRQTREGEVTCTVEFSSYSQGTFQSNITVSFDKDEHPERALIETSDDLYHDEGIIRIGQSEINEDITLIHKNPDNPNKLVVSFEQKNIDPFHIRFPPSELLTKCEKLSQSDTAATKIKQIVDIDGISDIYSILEAASHCLKPKGYIQVKNSLITIDDWILEEIDSDGHKSIADMLLARSKGTYLYTSDPNKLQDIISYHNEETKLNNIDYESLIKYLIRKTGKESKNSPVAEVLKHDTFIKYGENLSEAVFSSYLSFLFIKQDIESAKKLVNRWTDTTEQLNYSEHKKEILNSAEISEKLEGFRSMLSDSTTKNNNEFSFIAMKYLYWLGRKYGRKKSNLEERIIILRAAEHLRNKLGGLDSQRKKIEYNLQLSLGHKYKYDNYTRAQKHYSKALAVGQKFTWEGSVINPLRNLSEVEFWIYKENEEYGTGVEKLQNHIELIQQHPDIDINSNDYTMCLIKGLQSDMAAHHQIAEDGIGIDSIEKAKPDIEQAIRNYSQSGRDNLKNGAIGRKIHLEAIEYRMQGDFEKAAAMHEKYDDKLPDSDAAEYHQTEAWVCKAKSELIEGNYTVAAEKIDKIAENVGYIHSRTRPLQLLIEAAVDYKDGNKTESDIVYEELYSDEEEDDHILNVENKYASSLTQILSAQKLKELPIDNQIIDFIVENSIKSALSTESLDNEIAKGQKTELPTGASSVENVWKSKLPLHTIYKLQTAELNVQNSYDYDSAVEPLMRALERQMVSVVEYHARLQWDENWLSHILKSDSNNRKISLGNCFYFFKNNTFSGDLPHRKEIINRDEEKIVNETSIHKIRNILAHGDKLEVAETEQEYNKIRDSITDLMQLLLDITPVAFTMDKEMGFKHTYFIKLLRKSPNDKVIAKTQSELDSNEVYYMAPNSVGNDNKIQLQDDEMMKVEFPKGLDEIDV
jgi:tetratricopeptide (TPR) repeat protein